jgi:fructose-1,6-bisphosphatase II / sedoheptulose-1,7-bisphosphatase
LNAPDVYMQKISIGPGYAKGVVDLDAPPADNVRRLAKAKGVRPSEITALVMDRPRHGGHYRCGAQHRRRRAPDQ